MAQAYLPKTTKKLSISQDLIWGIGPEAAPCIGGRRRSDRRRSKFFLPKFRMSPSPLICAPLPGVGGCIKNINSPSRVPVFLDFPKHRALHSRPFRPVLLACHPLGWLFRMQKGLGTPENVRK